MPNHLNFFAPYQSLSPTHENQLTRALMVVLRYSPMAHQVWLRLVAPSLELQKLRSADFAVQQGRILPSHLTAEETEEIPGISVWLAPDAESIDSRVEDSSRKQVLDAIVSYGGELVVVIENKIGWAKSTVQPHQINSHGMPVRFEDVPRSVRWQEVLESLTDLVECDLVHGAERLLLSDFLDFVDENFLHIGPYSTLRRCGDSEFRISRRLDVIQGLAMFSDDGKGEGWRNISSSDKVFMAWLGFKPDDQLVTLEMYPADTLGQARAFYGDRNSVERVIALQGRGWRVRPNFHWGFAARGYAWCNSLLDVGAYCEYWMNSISSTREVVRSDWDSYLAKLEADGIVDRLGRKAFDQELVASRRQKVSARPGLCCAYSWPLHEAVGLDDRGELVRVVRERINEMLGVLGAPVLGEFS